MARRDTGVPVSRAAAARSGAATSAVPPYRGRAVDRLPAGKIQHAIFEIATHTFKDGQPPPEAENELNLTTRVETWNSRTRGRLVSTLTTGHLVSDDGTHVLPGGTIDDYSLSGDTCQRWQPAVYVITRRRCTGVNDRDTAVLEHSETGLRHHYRHRSRSFYDIATVRSRGRYVLRFRSSCRRPSGRDDTVIGDIPEGAPTFGPSRLERTARLLNSSFQLLSDETVKTFDRGGHRYVRTSVTRVLSRELLPDTPANRMLMKMAHPGAVVRRAPASHENPG